MFKNILFATAATGASDHAARVAFNIAENCNSHVTIFHVLGVPSRGFSQVVVDVKTREKVEVDGEYTAWVKEEIRTYYEKYLDKGLDCTIDVAVGVPAREILRRARAIKPDLVLIGGSTGSDEEVFYKKYAAGSTLQKVARSAPCPVLAVNRPAASFWGGVSNIVFGTDFSKTADRAFDFALKVARTMECELHVFHAVDINPVPGGTLLLSQDEIELKIREALKEIRKRYWPGLKTLKACSMDVCEGIPYFEIVKYARDKHADLIIMAHHSKKMVEENARFGGNVEQVIVRAGCPVLSMNK